MKLVIVHYHLRPGGIRRVIELAAPHLVRRLPGIKSITLATGEAGDPKWNNHFEHLLHPLPVTFFTDPAFGYLSEQKAPTAQITRRIQSALKKLLPDSAPDKFIVWAHNLGVGRNLLLARELATMCDTHHIPMVSHHHDWWFDNRWLRWSQLQRAGFRTLDAVSHAIFPPTRTVRHAVINQADAAVLKRHLPRSAGWLPNPASREKPPSTARVSLARRWMQHVLGEANAPIWILPCRLLRRKNIAEALLLTRWLRPEAWLVTTGGASSADELPYAAKLADAAQKRHWRLRLGILQGDEAHKPGVAELVAASECVLLTSIQEGFGLPYLEAAAAERPLIARALPNIAPDLKKFGFHFPQSYDELLVDPGLFDWRAEQARQTKLFHIWRSQLPENCRARAGTPVLLAKPQPRPVPFSRLTLAAQLEVLARPMGESWERCAPLNPFLKKWRDLAARGRLHTTAWPRKAGKWLGGPAYAERFCDLALAAPTPKPLPDKFSGALQADFIREKLGAGQMFPLLWSRES